MNTIDQNRAKQLRTDFGKLAEGDINEQTQLFLKSFIFALGDDWKVVLQLQSTYQKYCKEAGEGKDDLNPIQAADFLQKNGKERTALQRKDELKDVDLDNNDRICFIEYLLLHFKAMVLAEYYKRTGEKNPYDLTKNGVGITGVGTILLDELYTLPTNLDPILEKAIEEFTQKKKETEKKRNDLEKKAAEGGVKGLAAKNEIEQMDVADKTELNKVELTLNAAKKKIHER